MKRKRIGIAFFYHESHSFTPMITELEHFRNEAYLTGETIIAHYKGTKTEIGGFIDFLQEKSAEVEIVPLLCAAAVPSGVVTKETYEHIESEMLEIIKNSAPLDGVLLALHGAMVVEQMSNPEEILLGKIRQIVGVGIPIATTLDMHANIDARMLNHTPLHFGFKTYPHIDMYEQGRAAAGAVHQYLFENKKFKASFEWLPMLLPSLNMRTESGPMQKMIQFALEAEQIEGIENVSIFGGFPYADTPTSRASIIVVGIDENTVKEVIQKLTKQYWELKEEFIVDLPNAKEGLKVALSRNNIKPIVLADISDNPLSCGSGDTTELLRTMIDSDVEQALFGGLFDPESIEKCREAGEGQLVSLDLGGKVTPEYGSPVSVLAKIVKLTDGVFYNSGPMNQYLKVDLKGAAHIIVNNLDIVLIGRPMSANDPEMFRHLGIEPTDKKILGLKVKNHFRAAFDPLVEEIIYVDAPGVSTNNLSTLQYRQITHPIWPLDNLNK
ncbi:M81 family metallopeptidase [Virgibacillus sp. W0181]|uniref:M81 family metallopeptidase n=1 Tax=Virgibacillus sp. W0181 TaxID=3391581 RepID=UPI003F482BE4